jgi:hypothetical protein
MVGVPMRPMLPVREMAEIVAGEVEGRDPADAADAAEVAATEVATAEAADAGKAAAAEAAVAAAAKAAAAETAAGRRPGAGSSETKKNFAQATRPSNGASFVSRARLGKPGVGRPVELPQGLLELPLMNLPP